MPRWGRGWLELALDVLLPRACPGCREDLPPPISGPLCGPCLRRLTPLGTSERRLRVPGLDVALAAFPYRPPLPALLYAFKYEGSPSAGRALSGWLAGVAAGFPELRRAEAVVAVPLFPRKQRRRGFNQAAALAEAVARALRLPVLDALERVRDTPPQWHFSREERIKRMAESFRVKNGANLKKGRLLLIDDVSTSGGTLAGCGAALRRAGAAWVGACALARG